MTSPPNAAAPLPSVPLPAAPLPSALTTADLELSGWQHLFLTTGAPDMLETLLIELAPQLHALGRRGGEYWWIRKGDTLRLRLRQHTSTDGAQIIATARGQGATIHPGIYEPETHSFGGEAGLQIADRLACLDAHHLAEHLAQHRQHPHRHEMFLLLATRLMRGAGLDLFEQGDVWARVAACRPHQETVAASTRRAVRHMIFSGPDTASSPIAPSWSDTVTAAGRDLSELARTVRLTRGQRAVIAHLLLFMANRHGIHTQPLACLSTAAQNVIFQEDHHMAPPVQASTDTLDPATLRDQMADAVRARDGFAGPDSPVERAFRAVFRHQFVPQVTLKEAYGTQPVVTKRAEDGSALSSASAPALVARMLEQLAAQPGERILEIGAATGYNAALLGELVGPAGAVVSLEYDQDLTDGALAAIARTGYADRVEVRCGDGALGAPDRAPFDGIIVTVGAVDIPAAWWEQLTDTGRMIVPLELHPSGLTRCLQLHRTGPDTAVSTHQLVCGFVPMRGQAPVVASRTRLADDILLNHAPADITATKGLADAIAASPTWQHWTGLTFGMEPASVGHLDLWLATQQPIPFGRLSLADTAREAGLADPTRRWSGATLFHHATLAYLTTRDVEGGEEIGVAAHGPDAHRLGSDLVELARAWHAGPRQHEPTVTITRTGNSINPTVQW